VTVRVLVVDDETLIRAGLRMVLDTDDDIQVIGEAADGEQAVTAAAVLRPDVVLMDIRMPRLDGLAATARILEIRSAPKVVVLTTFNDDDYLQRALRLGASGFLLKVAPPEQLIEAVHVAARGDALLDPLVTRKVIEAFTATAPTRRVRPAELDQLTPREAEVLVTLARGMSNAEIATALHVGDATVKTHVARILTKLGLRDRVHAVIFAYEHGLIRPDTQPS
jgi:DNA-binding NarL/FixJ family response regulator